MTKDPHPNTTDAPMEEQQKVESEKQPHEGDQQDEKMNGTGDEVITEEEEDVTNLQLAWEMFELTVVICSEWVASILSSWSKSTREMTMSTFLSKALIKWCLLTLNIHFIEQCLLTLNMHFACFLDCIRHLWWSFFDTWPTFTCSKLIIGTLEQGG